MRQGDPITIVLEGQLVLIECSYVADDYVLAGVYRLGTLDEGVAWLKGYHTPNEACVTAARTCQALREKEQSQGCSPGVTGPTGMPGVQGVPFGNPFTGYPPPSPPQSPARWPECRPDNTRLVLATSNTKGLF